MTEKNNNNRGPMVHIRLDEETHRKLKIIVAQSGTTMQQLVKDLILNQVKNSEKKNSK